MKIVALKTRGLVLVQEGLYWDVVHCVEFFLHAGYVLGFADLVAGLRGVDIGADAPDNSTFTDC